MFPVSLRFPVGKFSSPYQSVGSQELYSPSQSGKQFSPTGANLEALAARQCRDIVHVAEWSFLLYSLNKLVNSFYMIACYIKYTGKS